MSEKEKQIIKTLADKLPAMSERERGLDGFYQAVMFRGRRDGSCSQKKRKVIERLHGFGLEDGI